MTQATQSTLTKFLNELHSWETQQLEQALNAIQHELKNRPDVDQITITWHVEDVQGQRPELTVAQCRQVLKALERNHDATVGINWDVIDCVADELQE